MKIQLTKFTHLIKYTAVATTAIIIAACGTQNNELKKNLPTASMAKATNSDLATIGEGHAIYMRHCSQCHEPKLPSTIPTDVWHVIVPGMAWNAGLSPIEEKNVTAYIKAASKYNEMQVR